MHAAGAGRIVTAVPTGITTKRGWESSFRSGGARGDGGGIVGHGSRRLQPMNSMVAREWLPRPGVVKAMRLALCLAAALAATVCFAVAPTGPAAPRLVAQNLTRDQIRSMPIVERPNRPIHFSVSYTHLTLPTILLV